MVTGLLLGGVVLLAAVVTLVLLDYVTGESLDRHPHRVSRREYRRELEAHARAQEARTDAAIERGAHAALEDAWSDAFTPPAAPCSHYDAVDVEDVTGELVARWCPTCERQLDLDEVHGPPASACSCPEGMGHQRGCPHRRDVHAARGPS